MLRHRREHIIGQPGFFDLSRRYEGLDAKQDPLVAILAAVPFELFQPKLKAALAARDQPNWRIRCGRLSPVPEPKFAAASGRRFWRIPPKQLTVPEPPLTTAAAGL